MTTTLRGRAAGGNPANRFERLVVASEEPPPEALPTLFLRDSSRSVIARNDSPDVGFDASLNPYRGCEHGCAYCYARPTHEYLGFSAGLDFETRILVKEDAPELLRRELDSPRWEPRLLALSGVTDPYQPIERRVEITRRCLRVLAEYRNPVGLITKNALVTRDSDLLSALTRYDAVSVAISITTLDQELARRLEPRASRPADRLRAIRHLAASGIPVGVSVAPVIPGLTDHEIPAILEAAAAAGARFASWVMLRLPGAVAELFTDWLERNEPDRRDKILSRVRTLRGGRLNDPRFGSRGRGEGPFAEQIRALFDASVRRAGIPQERPRLSVASFRRPGGVQLGLFAARE
ncbi:MAG: PA0069 family radical SAM protein [Thermoanaerobaculia bacterium]